MTYLSTLFSFGMFECESVVLSMRVVTKEYVKKLLEAGSVYVFVPQPSFAECLSNTLGVEISPRKERIVLNPGDTLILCRAEGHVDGEGDTPLVFHEIRIYSGL